MKLVRKHPWLLLLVLVGLGFLALNVLAFRHAWSMTHFSSGGTRTERPEDLSWKRKIGVLFSGVILPRPSGTRTPDDAGLPYRPMRISSQGDQFLGAWYCLRAQEAPLVILFHGHGADKSSLLSEAGALYGLGCSVLLVDFRGSGESWASYTTLGYAEAEDVADTVRFARQNLPYSHIILYGQSMGAAAILRALHAGGAEADAVILESVFDTLLHTIRNRFDAMGLPSFPSAELLVFWGGRQTGFDGFKHNPLEYAQDVTCPALFLHGADDPRARIVEARNVYDAVPGRKRLVEFPGAGHESLLAREPVEWRKVVEDFLRETRNRL